MESEADQEQQHDQEIEEESQDSQTLDEINVHLEESYEIASPTNPLNASRGKYYKQTYRPAWEQMPDFKGWLKGVVGEPTRAYCTYCQKTLHAHRLSLLKHTCTIRHQKAAQIHNARKDREMLPILGEVTLDTGEMNEEEIENEEGETITYAEMGSEADEDDHHQKDNENDTEDDEEESMEIHGVSYEKQNNQNYQGANPRAPISTNVVDSTRGSPVAGLQVSLYKLIDGRWTYINEAATNVNGKVGNFFDRAEFTPGRYKLHYDVDRYFDARKQDTMYPFIEVVFDCRTVNDVHHIPIFLSPYGYSTFKA